MQLVLILSSLFATLRGVNTAFFPQKYAKIN